MNSLCAEINFSISHSPHGNISGWNIYIDILHLFALAIELYMMICNKVLVWFAKKVDWNILLVAQSI